MRLSANVEIDAPVRDVWSCIADPVLIVAWVEGAREHRYLEPDAAPRTPGQRFVQVLEQGGKPVEFTGTLTDVEPHARYAFDIPSPAYSSHAEFRLAALGDARTRVDYTIDVTLHTLKARLAAVALRLPLAFFVPRQMRRLKALAESLPNGAGTTGNAR